VLYLIDSIVKNVGDVYTSLFTQNIVSTFCGVFEKVLYILIFLEGGTLIWGLFIPSSKILAFSFCIKKGG
jgi:hypothetical protein